MRCSVERLMARWWASLTMVKANSSRVQAESGVAWSSVRLLASVRTARRSSGGKAPGSAGAWGVLQARQAVGDKPLAPLADGVAVTIQFGGDRLVGRSVGLCGPQDQPATQGQGLRGGTGAGERFQLGTQFGRQ